jgi:hypothetical protein
MAARESMREGSAACNGCRSSVTMNHPRLRPPATAVGCLVRALPETRPAVQWAIEAGARSGLTLLLKSVNGHQVLAISFDTRMRWYVASRRLLVTWA